MTIQGIGHLLRALLGTIMTQEEYARLTGLQLMVLYLLYTGTGPHTADSLKRDMTASRTTTPSDVNLDLAHAITGLVDLDLIERRDNPDGERSMYLWRTRKGMDFINDVILSVREGNRAASLAESAADAARFSLPGTHLVTRSPGGDHGPNN